MVTGLELVRNCETHALVLADDLLVEKRRFGVPLQMGGTLMRSVFAWANYDELPTDYRELLPMTTGSQQRARREAQHGYRDAVQDRHVVETLFDAMAFFEAVDTRLVGTDGPHLPWAYGEAYAQLPAVDADQATSWTLARPMGLDAYEPFLPDIVCRYTERRSAQWPAADAVIKERRKQAASRPPRAAARQVLYVLSDGDQVLGYSGYAPMIGGRCSTWVERRSQVWRDVKKGYSYYLAHDAARVHLQAFGNKQVKAASSGDGSDLLMKLPLAAPGALGPDRLEMVEEYPDMYLEMREAS